ncbi:hypothetical protein ACFV3R_19970 [Streptomyces sp. NPDC059740]|uniref:hypothetical protein n=1 Tax=Streptomyces sp. NPDC059740 TaxID=3346926 RepID=UPI0036490021
MEAGPQDRPRGHDPFHPDEPSQRPPVAHEGPAAEDPPSLSATDGLGPPVDGGPTALDRGPAGPPEGEDAESFRELRPPRRLRLWQLAPIVCLATLGSLMFAFPLAFEFGGEGGAVVAMLGLLLCCCAAGWGMTAARKVGHTWPGLAPGAPRRRRWQALLAYTAVTLVLAALAIWRVARLR